MIKPLYIVWKDEFNINNPILDEQHRAVVTSINSLYYFIQQGWGLAALEPTLKIIRMYSSFHAKTEEGILGQLDCPHMQEHINSQKRFEKDVNEASKEAIDMKDPQILLTFLRKWWQKHLNEEHAHYAEFYETESSNLQEISHH